MPLHSRAEAVEIHELHVSRALSSLRLLRARLCVLKGVSLPPRRRGLAACVVHLTARSVLPLAELSTVLWLLELYSLLSNQKKHRYIVTVDHLESLGLKYTVILSEMVSVLLRGQVTGTGEAAGTARRCT